MPGNPVKFRCYHCNQLLGISRSKSGAVISCPKCRASLLVPAPEEDASSPGSSSVGADVSAAFSNGPSSVSSDSILDIRPEDIRVEPEFATRRPATEEPRATPEPASKPPPVHPELIAAAAVPTSAPSRAAPPISAADLLPDADAVVPAVQIEAPTPRTSHERPAPVRPRDVVLPRSVVLAWSLFVLLALASSFAAGLLAGHYVWRVH